MPSTSNSINSLVHGTVIEGSIITENDSRFDGKLVGTIKSKGKVIIGPSGEIEGEIQCKNAVIEGRFKGLLVVQELLHVKESAHIAGDVVTKKLIVQSGSVFDVTCKMGSQKIKDINTKDKAGRKKFEELPKAVHQ